MTNTQTDLRTIILKFIEQFELQSTDAQLAELQKTMFLFQRLSNTKFLRYSIFNYGPYSFDLESELDDLLVERSVERYGSKFRVTVSLPSTSYDETIRDITSLIKSVPPTEMQKACTVMYFWDKSGDEVDAVDKARRVSPKSDIHDFQLAYGALSNKLNAMAVG